MTGVHKASVGFSIAAALLYGEVASVTRAQVASAGEDPSLASPAMAVAMPSTEPSAGDTAAPEVPREETNRRGGGFHGQGWFGGMGSPNMSGPGAVGPGASGAGDGGDLADLPDGAEWQQISTFMIDHSPRRWAFYNRLPDGGRQHGMMRVATRAFRNYQKAQHDDPKLAAVMIQSIEAQDAVFGLVMDIRVARRSGDTDKAKALAADLPTKVGTLVDVSFKERQLRVDQLQKTLDDLKTHLAADEKNRDGVIADRVRALSGQHPGGFGGGPGGFGGGASSPGGGNSDATGVPTAAPAPQPVTVDLTSPH